MTTPSQSRKIEHEKDAEKIPTMSVIDEGFDELYEANAEFVQWRWPRDRDE